MKKINYIIAAFASLSFLVSCSSDDDGGVINGGENPPVEMIQPGTAQLIFPERDRICTTGIFISETESRVTFEWNASENTDSYDVVLTNLGDNTVETLSANTNTLDITLQQNAQYSWAVISKSNASELTATSPVWRFYNAEEGARNFSPFPTELVNPINATTVMGTSITLEWLGADPNGPGNIASYNVFLGTSTELTTLLSSTEDTSINSGVLAANTQYYWRVETVDHFGSSTSSQVFSFKTL